MSVCVCVKDLFLLDYFLFKEFNVQIMHNLPMFLCKMFIYAVSKKFFTFLFIISSAQLSTLHILLVEDVGSKTKQTSFNLTIYHFASVYLTVTWLMNKICWTTKDDKTLLKPWFLTLTAILNQSLNFSNKCTLLSSSGYTQIWNGSENSECGLWHKVPLVWWHSGLARAL